MKTLPCAVCQTPVPFDGPHIGRPTVFCAKHVREGLAVLPELFNLDPSPLPELTAARLRLRRAEELLAEYETEGSDDLGITTASLESEVRMAATNVLRLERAALNLPVKIDADPDGTRDSGEVGH